MKRPSYERNNIHNTILQHIISYEQLPLIINLS
jgi:hypothetical protein